jgi:hypothetical protein
VKGSSASHSRTAMPQVAGRCGFFQRFFCFYWPV